jgi:hypothetical protein
LVQGKYFMLAGGHDLWSPHTLSRGVSILEAEPAVVLAYSGGVCIDINDRPLDMPMDQFDTRGLNARQRYLKVIWNLLTCSSMYGVIRTAALRESQAPQNIWGPDYCLLGELALKGEFALISEPMFFRRIVRPEEHGQIELRKRRVLIALDPEKNKEKVERTVQDLFRELRDALLQRVQNSELSFPDKLRAQLGTYHCFEKRFGVQLPAFFWRKRLPGFVKRGFKRYKPELLGQGGGAVGNVRN